MPIGQHLTQCLHCGKEFICGDCILTTCRECEQAGHDSQWSTVCAQCEGERLDRIVKLMDEANKLVVKYQSVHRGE